MVLPFTLFITFLVSTGIAFRWGGFDERFCAVAMTIATVVSNLDSTRSFAQTETSLVIVDLLLFLALLVVALRSDRFWPMWATAFQLVAMLVHAGSTVQQGDFAWAYYIALVFWSFPALIALGAGTWLEVRRRSW